MDVNPYRFKLTEEESQKSGKRLTILTKTQRLKKHLIISKINTR